jgi:putative hydrolase of the HAD superfamily
MISTLLFDAGGTLVTPNFRRMADEYARDGVAVEPERLALAEALARLDFERPDFVRSHPDDMWLSYMHDIARKAEVERPPRAAFERLRAYHDSENLWEELIAGTEGALTELGSRYRLGVISNANGTVKKVFARIGIARFFEVIVDSAEVGIEKPDVRVFELALTGMNVRADEAAYVGDVFKIDVLGAHAAGMRAVLIDPHGFHADKPCPRVTSLRELSPMLFARAGVGDSRDDG